MTHWLRNKVVHEQMFEKWFPTLLHANTTNESTNFRKPAFTFTITSYNMKKHAIPLYVCGGDKEEQEGNREEQAQRELEKQSEQRDGKKKDGGGYGVGLKDDYRRFFGTQVGMAGRGTAIARADNYCEIDPNGVVDKYGIPVLRFNYKWTNDEINQAKHMQETFQEILHNMGAIYGTMQGKDTNYGLEAPGKIIHEVGTVRMGDDPKKSALNKWCQAHDCKNLFVVDAAPFVQQGDKNATWTILALSMRTAEYIIQERKKLNV